jgi:hypothetical protein
MFFQKLKTNPCFLESSLAGEDNPMPGLNKFWALDSKKNFEENLKKLPQDWYYRTHDVTYTVNSLGYRAPEFKEIDWANSVVMFGCSTVFGDGVDDNDTIPAQLSKIINKPVINLGAGGSSMDWSFHNSLILKEWFPTPLAVVHIWTDPSRILIYNRDTPQRTGVWDTNTMRGLQNWIVEENILTRAYFTRLAAKNIWKNIIPYYDLSWSPVTVDATGCNDVPEESKTANSTYKDLARDLCHQGPKSLEIIAKDIADNLAKQDFKF